MGKVKNSYQRRLREIKYLQQCITELEEITVFLAKQINNSGGTINFMFKKGISGDMFITKYNSPPDFYIMGLQDEK